MYCIVNQNLLTPAAATGAGDSPAPRPRGVGSAQPSTIQGHITWLKRLGRKTVTAFGSPVTVVGLEVVFAIETVRYASLRSRPYGPLTAFPLPAAYPVAGMAGDPLRVIALHMTADHAGMIAALIVAWVLAWSQVQPGRELCLASATPMDLRRAHPARLRDFARPRRRCPSPAQNGKRAFSLTSFITKNVRVCLTPGRAISFCPWSLLKSSMSRTRILSK